MSALRPDVHLGAAPWRSGGAAGRYALDAAGKRDDIASTRGGGKGARGHRREGEL